MKQLLKKKIIDTTTKQINSLEREKNTLINESKELQKSVKENINSNSNEYEKENKNNEPTYNEPNFNKPLLVKPVENINYK